MSEANEDDFNRQRQTEYSPGHDPPRYVDRSLPSLPVRIFADGGPAKTSFGAQGTNPWILGSFTIGSGKVFEAHTVDFHSGSPNVWFAVRNNHPGSNTRLPGGTIRKFHLPSRGDLVRQDRNGIFWIRGPGTISLYGFGAGSVGGTSSNRVHRALSIAGGDRFSGLLEGHIR